MAEQMSNSMEQQQPQQMTLSDFLLGQRRLIDQIVASYENNMSQMAQHIEKQIKELEGLKKDAKDKPEASQS